MAHFIKNILTNEEITFLKKFYKTLKQQKPGNYRNLYKTTVKTLKNEANAVEWLPPADILSPNEEKSWMSIESKLDLVYNGTSVAHYFVCYEVGSRADIHKDRVPNTLVTIIEASDDLEGGSTVLIENGIPISLNPKPGETLSYSDFTIHGVGSIIKGTRLALISWYN